MTKKSVVPCEVYSRIVGYFRPVQNWNVGKRKEFEQRTEYDVKTSKHKDAAIESCKTC
jgi:hypothetical protein|tara:strand:+ start:456 stop:629 length:174 start_codon:yes stop_codon:yes gene_type:complete